MPSTKSLERRFQQLTTRMWKAQEAWQSAEKKVKWDPSKELEPNATAKKAQRKADALLKKFETAKATALRAEKRYLNSFYPKNVRNPENVRTIRKKSMTVRNPESVTIKQGPDGKVHVTVKRKVKR